MNSLHWYLLITAFTLNQASATIIYLENCTYSLNLYKQYLNLLWSSNDSRTLHIQAVYSLSSNASLIPGHIYTNLFPSAALVPFFVQCKYPEYFSSKSYLSFTQCASTITNFLTRKNHESTRTNLYLKTILFMPNVSLLYIGEYNILLSNCSFKLNSKTYRLKPSDIFKFHIEYENSINNNNNNTTITTTCSKCNKRTSICYEKRCICRPGTTPFKLYKNNDYCIDTTSNCSYDSQRCLPSKSIPLFNKRSNQYFLILILLISLLFMLFLFLLWCLLRNARTHTFTDEKDLSSNPPIFTIHRHERTPSTISTTDSVKLNDYNCIDQHILANEYVSTIYEDYPKIISNKNNAEVVLILV
ncbi:unnamed protein product [Rotaria socialis]|uniref:Uncharacterized protein n=1 Tax=Rotaria socialis TaxID=392032 RepID=A0A820JV37_9BILA|nr:unnamed protein product [Rotaria socialis]CAF3653045.1 unnamed protein product [Rotaria socialis]CAF3724300.1 unnamed protein product [Rotaria socialis]CAF4258695.1 unnamed protein product [Rotaria socialis]CAF4327574.1 unnamed protein product [Rotaria socialis]